jgi:hypothetical protein
MVSLFKFVHVFIRKSVVSMTFPFSFKYSFPLGIFLNFGYIRALVRFEVLTAVSTKMAVFWVVAPCSLVEVYQRFRGPCCLHHQGDHRPTTRRYNPEDSHIRALVQHTTPFIELQTCRHFNQSHYSRPSNINYSSSNHCISYLLFVIS